MKRDRIIYWISTGLLSLMMTVSGVAYILSHDEAVTVFASLGYPAHLVYFLAVLKLLGVVAILTKKSTVLKYLAYAGFFYTFLLAAVAHLYAGDGRFAPALVAMALLVVSYVYDRKLYHG